MSAPLVLASASPRRRELLARIGIAVETLPATVDETPLPGEEAIACALRLAAAKADEIVPIAGGRCVLGADTVVEIDGRILGKPADAADALAMVASLVGRTHRVTTAFALRGDGVAVTRAITAEVVMRDAGEAELASYVAAGEWRGKAGGYAVQGMAAAMVREVRGSVTAVIGLPLAEVVEELAATGLARPTYVPLEAA